MKLRTGSSVGRTIYVQRGPQASKKDALVGMFDTEQLAGAVVEAFNEKVDRAVEEMVTPQRTIADGSAMDQVIMQLLQELAAQDAKWGEQNHEDGTGQLGDDVRREMAKEVEQAAAASVEGTTWRLILDEEVKEAFAETDPALLRAELLQVAGVALQWAAAIDRRAEA